MSTTTDKQRELLQSIQRDEFYKPRTSERRTLRELFAARLITLGEFAATVKLTDAGKAELHTDTRPLLTPPSDGWAELPAHVYVNGHCERCGLPPVGETYEQYVAQWYATEYEGERDHHPTEREDWDYMNASCLGGAARVELFTRDGEQLVRYLDDEPERGIAAGSEFYPGLLGRVPCLVHGYASDCGWPANDTLAVPAYPRQPRVVLPRYADRTRRAGRTGSARRGDHLAPRHRPGP